MSLFKLFQRWIGDGDPVVVDTQVAPLVNARFSEMQVAPMVKTHYRPVDKDGGVILQGRSRDMISETLSGSYDESNPIDEPLAYTLSQIRLVALEIGEEALYGEIHELYELLRSSLKDALFNQGFENSDFNSSRSIYEVQRRMHAHVMMPPSVLFLETGEFIFFGRYRAAERPAWQRRFAKSGSFTHQIEIVRPFSARQFLVCPPDSYLSRLRGFANGSTYIDESSQIIDLELDGLIVPRSHGAEELLTCDGVMPAFGIDEAHFLPEGLSSSLTDTEIADQLFGKSTEFSRYLLELQLLCERLGPALQRRILKTTTQVEFFSLTNERLFGPLYER